MRSEWNTCALLLLSCLLYICRAELIYSYSHYSEHCEITGVGGWLKVRDTGRRGYNAGNIVGFKKGNGALLVETLICETCF